jgi:hypothetical protein
MAPGRIRQLEKYAGGQVCAHGAITLYRTENGTCPRNFLWRSFSRSRRFNISGGGREHQHRISRIRNDRVCFTRRREPLETQSPYYPLDFLCRWACMVSHLGELEKLQLAGGAPPLRKYCIRKLPAPVPADRRDRHKLHRVASRRSATA